MELAWPLSVLPSAQYPGHQAKAKAPLLLCSAASCLTYLLLCSGKDWPNRTPLSSGGVPSPALLPGPVSSCDWSGQASHDA